MHRKEKTLLFLCILFRNMVKYLESMQKTPIFAPNKMLELWQRMIM